MLGRWGGIRYYMEWNGLGWCGIVWYGIKHGEGWGWHGMEDKEVGIWSGLVWWDTRSVYSLSIVLRFASCL